MKIWIVSVGEPLPTDQDARIRRMGILGKYITENTDNTVDWFSASFDHYKKVQRAKKNTDITINLKYTMHIVKTNGYKRNVSPARILQHISSGKGIYKRMVDMGYKPDVILASMEPLEVSKETVRFAKENNIPIIVDVRDLWPEIYYEAVKPEFHWLIKPYVKRCQRTLRLTMNAASGIVGMSEGFLEYGLKYANRKKGIYDASIPVAYPNYDYEEYRGKYNYLQEKYGITEDDFVILFLGNFGNQFDFTPIIKASEKLLPYNNVKFVLAGTGAQIDEVKSNVRENVIFTGWIGRDDILSLVANSKLGIAPYIDSMNYRLNTPNIFGEYLFASLPILISVDGVMKRLLEQHRCGMKYSDGESLSNIILELYNNPIKQNEFASNSRKLYLEMFEEKTVNERFLGHIKKVSKGAK